MTNLADLVRSLVAAGATPEMIALAVEAMEKERAEISAKDKDRKAKNAARQKAWRHRNATVTSLERDENVTPPLEGPPSSPDPINPPYNPPISPSGDARVRGADTLRANAEFGDWWLRYPHKVGKAEALRAFLKARQRASLQDLLDGLDRYARRLKQPNAPPPCNPATWLNQDRWNDEPMDTPNARQPPSRPAKPTPTAADYFATVLPGFGGGAGGADDIPGGGAGWGDGVRGDSVVVEGAEFGFSRRAAGG